jgi:hypothetical protein
MVDRDPWRLELYCHDGESLRLVATGLVGDGDWIQSHVLDLRIRLQSGADRPRIEVCHGAQGRTWRI